MGSGPPVPDPAGGDQDQDRRRQYGQGAVAEVPDHPFQQRPVVAQQVAQGPDHDRPGAAPDGAEDLEAQEGHARHAGQDRGPGAQAEHEAADQDGLVAVEVEEHLGPGQVGGAEPEEAPEALDKRPAPPPADHVAEVGAGDRAQGAAEDHEPDVEAAGGRQGGHGQQGGLAWERDPRALDQDPQGGGRIADRLGDGADIDVHWVNHALTRRPDEASTRPTYTGLPWASWPTTNRTTPWTSSATPPPTCWRRP